MAALAASALAASAALADASAGAASDGSADAARVADAATATPVRLRLDVDELADELRDVGPDVGSDDTCAVYPGAPRHRTSSPRHVF